MLKSFPFYKQADSKDCGPTCLKIISRYYGKVLNIQTLRNLSETTREGSNLLYLSDAAEKIGFRSLGVKLSVEKLDDANNQRNSNTDFQSVPKHKTTFFMLIFLKRTTV